MRSDFSETINSHANPVHRAEILQQAYELRLVEWAEIMREARFNPHIPLPLEPRRPDLYRLCTLMQIQEESLTPQELTDINTIFSR
jgi:hypothetical protein